MKHLQSIKAEIDRVNLEVQNAERDYDLNQAAELKYGTLMTLQKQLKEAEAALEAQAPNITPSAPLCIWLHLFCFGCGCVETLMAASARQGRTMLLGQISK